MPKDPMNIELNALVMRAQDDLATTLRQNDILDRVIDACEVRNERVTKLLSVLNEYRQLHTEMMYWFGDGPDMIAPPTRHHFGDYHMDDQTPPKFLHNGANTGRHNPQ
jgi:hypothetical protein